MNDSFNPERLSELLDQRLTPAEAELWRARLASADEAAAVWGDLQAVRGQLQNLPACRPADGLRQRIMQQVQNEGDWRREPRAAAEQLTTRLRGLGERHFTLTGLRTIAGVLAVAAALLIGLLLFPGLLSPRVRGLVSRPPSPAELGGESPSASARPENIAAAPAVETPPSAQAIAAHDSASAAGEQSPPHLLLPPFPAPGRTPPPGSHVPPSPPQRAEGVEFLVVVDLPATIEPSQQWIESVFRRAEQPNDDPNADLFGLSLNEPNREPPGETPLRTPPAQDRYVVQADAKLFRLIVDRMPAATIECTVIDQSQDGLAGGAGLPASALHFRRVEPSGASDEPGELNRANKLLKALQIDEFSPREYSFLFEFRFNR